jgi:hypothetical protein
VPCQVRGTLSWTHRTGSIRFVCFAFHFFSARGAAASRALDKRTVVNFADRPRAVFRAARENLRKPAIRADCLLSVDDGVPFLSR